MRENMKIILAYTYKLFLTILGACCLLYAGIVVVFLVLDGSAKQFNEYTYISAPLAYMFGVFSFCSIHQCKKLKFTIPFAVILPLFIIGIFVGAAFLFEELGCDTGKGGLVSLLVLVLSLYIVRRANAWLGGKA